MFNTATYSTFSLEKKKSHNTYNLSINIATRMKVLFHSFGKLSKWKFLSHHSQNSDLRFKLFEPMANDVLCVENDLKYS